MKISSHNSFDINVLKGALIINPNGAEFYIKGVSVDVVNHSISIDLDNGQSLEWSTLKDWEIQFHKF
tara:strand:+ start:331 stop:531 length:201 start_codon:yes stop_codon:yes gene_type:complete